MLVLVVKQRLSTTADTGFAGGQHIVRCIAKTLHQASHDVHLLTCGSREQVLQALLLHGTLSSVKHAATPGMLSYADACGYNTHVACPEDTTHQPNDSCNHDLQLPLQQQRQQQRQQQQQDTQRAGDMPAPAPPPLAALLQHVQHLSSTDGANQATHAAAAAAAAAAAGKAIQSTATSGNPTTTTTPTSNSSSSSKWGGLAVILDMDGCSAALFSGLVQLFPGRVFALIQNIHFLPFGPSGCAPRDPLILQQWQQLAGTMCVSRYVAEYVTQHGPQVAVAAPGAVHVVYNRAWGAWGPGPWPDWGSQHQQHLFGRGLSGRQGHADEGASAAAATSDPRGQGVGGRPGTATTAAEAHMDARTAAAAAGSTCRRPLVGMLKVTPEKGAAVLAALAQRLTQFDFLGVCGDPGVAAALQRKALPNLQLLEPVANVDELLQRVHVVVAPSIWCEAFGMVVVDALLRGIPVLASDMGGLSEAALGAARLLPIAGIQLPLVAAGTGAGAAGWRLGRHGSGGVASQGCAGSAEEEGTCSSPAGLPGPSSGTTPTAAAAAAKAAGHSTVAADPAAVAEAVSTAVAAEAGAEAKTAAPAPAAAETPTAAERGGQGVEVSVKAAAGCAGVPSGSGLCPAVIAAVAGPQWSQRVLPGAQHQPVATWAAALCMLLTDAEAYAAASRSGRAAAISWLADSADELQSVLDWMQQRLGLLGGPIGVATPSWI